MERFLDQHKGRIAGSISGFDRMLMRGTLRSISNVEGMGRFLSSQRVLLKDFGKYAKKLSDRLKETVVDVCGQTNRPYIYLGSAKKSKEEIAQELINKDNVEEGLVCVLATVEMCWSFDIERDASQKQLRLVSRQRKCLHYYFYYVDREFGLMHVRLQSWLPFAIQVCVNGREWLARQMDHAGIAYRKHENGFTWIADIERAQQILIRLEERKWVRMLQGWAKQVNPYEKKNPLVRLQNYYWTVIQAEYATDILFDNAASLQAIYPALVHHAIEQFHTKDVLRFLARRTNKLFSGKATSTMVERIEGVRVKHWIEQNSIKMYDKAGSILRVETTLNNPRPFKTRRRVLERGRYRLKWLRMRKGIVDIRRHSELCRAANYRYLDALAVVESPNPSHQVLEPLCRSVRHKNRKYRALNPIAARECPFFQAMLQGEHLIQGFRNRDLRKALLLDHTSGIRLSRRATAQVSRHLSLYRAHGLIARIPGTHRYRVTKKGHAAMPLALKLRMTSLASLEKNLC
jgi:hypothetical protein